MQKSRARMSYDKMNSRSDMCCEAFYGMAKYGGVAVLVCIYHFTQTQREVGVVVFEIIEVLQKKPGTVAHVLYSCMYVAYVGIQAREAAVTVCAGAGA